MGFFYGLLWGLSSNGDFTVSSMYDILLMKHHNFHINQSPPSFSSSPIHPSWPLFTWKAVWSLHIPNLSTYSISLFRQLEHRDEIPVLVDSCSMTFAFFPSPYIFTESLYVEEDLFCVLVLVNYYSDTKRKKRKGDYVYY